MKGLTREQACALLTAHAVAKRQTSLASRAGWMLPLFCASMSVALHASLITPLILEGGRGGQKSVNGEGARTRAGTIAYEMILVPLEDQPSDIEEPRATIRKFALSPKQLEQQRSIRLSAKALEIGSLLDHAEAADGELIKARGDTPEGALMYSRHMGQITARIERAWIRPRSSTGSGQFKCRVEIEQDGRGNVEKVTPQECNADSIWRLSLVHAIQAASPLPVPPDPAVYRKSMILEFESPSLEAGGREEGFEPPLAVDAVSSPRPDASARHDDNK